MERQEPCRGKQALDYVLLMSLAGDAGSLETILISKFGSKVSTTHSVFFGTELTVSFARTETS